MTTIIDTEPLPPSIDGQPSAPPRRPRRHRVRNLLVLGVSTLIVAAALLYVVAPAKEAVALSVRDTGHVGGAPDHTAIYHPVPVHPSGGKGSPSHGGGSDHRGSSGSGHSGSGSSGPGNGSGHGGSPGHPSPPLPATEVLYGTVSGHDGLTVTSANLSISSQDYDASFGHGAPATTVSIGSTGSYRAVVHLPDGRYAVTITVAVGGRLLHQSTVVSIIDGRAYDVSAIVSVFGIFSFLPVSSY